MNIDDFFEVYTGGNNNTIQELKTWAEDERKKAKQSADLVNRMGGMGLGYEGEANAFFRIIQKLDLFLNSENKNNSKSFPK
jgi:hypothetical protein